MAQVFSDRLYIIVDAATLPAAQAEAIVLDPVGGAGAFKATLSPTGAPPPTHYWTSWAMTPAQRTLFEANFTALVNSGHVWIFDAATTTVAQMLTAMNLKRVTSNTV